MNKSFYHPYKRRRTTQKKPKDIIMSTRKQYFKQKQELKWKDTALSSVAMNASPVFSSVCSIAVGTGTQQMLGDEVEFVSVSYKLMVNNSSSGLGGLVRIIIFQNIDAGVINPLSVNNVTSLINMQYRKNIKILRDETQYVGSFVASTFEAPRSCFFKGHIKLKGNQKCPINGGTAGKNDIGYCLVCEQTSNQPTVTGTVRVRYTDN